MSPILVLAWLRYPLLKRVELGTSVGNEPHFDRGDSTRRVGETYDRGRFRADEEREITARIECGQDRFAQPAKKGLSRWNR